MSPANAGARAWWKRIKADPELYAKHIAKVKEGFIKQRMKGIGFFRKSKRNQ